MYSVEYLNIIRKKKQLIVDPGYKYYNDISTS